MKRVRTRRRTFNAVFGVGSVVNMKKMGKSLRFLQITKELE